MMSHAQGSVHVFTALALVVCSGTSSFAGQTLSKPGATAVQPLAQKLQDAADAANDLATNNGYPNTANWSSKLADEAEDLINQLSDAVGGADVELNDIRDGLRDMRKTLQGLTAVASNIPSTADKRKIIRDTTRAYNALVTGFRSNTPVQPGGGIIFDNSLSLPDPP